LEDNKHTLALQQEKFKDLYKKLYEMEVRKSGAEKNLAEFFGDRTDN
jgi:hypothetical protein